MASKEQSLDIRINADANKAIAELKSVTTQLKRLEGEVKKGSASTKQLQSSFDSVAGSASGFAKTLAGLAAGYASMSGAKEFVGLLTEMENGYIGVAKTTGMAGEELEKLKGGIEDLSTKLAGVSVTELQGIAETAGQLGIQGTENILSFTETVAKMATATDLSAEEAATAFAKLGNALQEPVSAYERMGSVMNELSNQTTATVSEIVDVSGRFAGMGKTVGLSTEQIFGLSAAMIDMGMQTEVAGSSLSTIFGQMLKESEKFAKVAGVSAKKFAETMRKDPVEALKLFLAQLGKMDPTKQVQALKELGLSGIRTSAAVLKLSGNLGVLDRDLKVSNDEWKRGTSLQKEYETAAKGLDAQWQQTKNTLMVLAARIGEALLPALKDINTAFREWVDGIDEETLRNFGDSVASLVTGLANLAGAVGSVIGPIASFAANNVKLTAGLVVLYKSVGSLSGILPRLSSATAGASGAFAGFRTAATATSGAVGLLRGAIGAVMTLLGPGGALIAAAFAAATAAIGLHEQSVRKDAEANRELAAQLDAHAGRMSHITDLYLKANTEQEKSGSISQRTSDEIRTALEAEIATLEKQLSAWERNTESTKEQDAAARQMAATLGQLQAQLDTLDAQYTTRVELDDESYQQKLQRIEAQLDAGMQGTATVTGDTSDAEAKVDALKAKIDGTRGTATVTGDTSDANAKVDALKAKIDGTRGTATVTGNTSDANAKVDALKAKIDTTKGTVSVDAETDDAESKVEKTESEINDTTSTLTIDADVSAVERAKVDIQHPTKSLHEIDPDATRVYGVLGRLSSTKTSSDHVVSPDVGRVWSELARLNGHNTYSYHTIYVREVHTRANGGYIDGPVRRAFGGSIPKRFDYGGRVPGYDPTDSDKVPALLTAGEFVLRRSAVDYYGTSLLQALNAMRLPKFAEGGSVGGASTASPAETQPINLHIGGKSFPVMSDREVAEALTRYIDEQGGL